MKTDKINDTEREQWVMSDEGLYNMFRRSKHRTEAAFVRTHRKEIDEVIRNVTSGQKRQHYLAYGG